MSPTNYVSCILVALQAIVGLLMEACSIGLVYAKFSRATTRASSIMFSKNAIIGNRDDKKSFFFRFSDIRKHQLLEPHIRIYFATNKCTKEGEDFLNFQQMKITVGDSFIVFLSGYPTTVVHEIDEESPIYNVEDFKLGEIIVILEGIDSTTASTIQARYSYSYSDIIFNARFASMIHHRPDGVIEADFSKFDEILLNQ